MTREGKEGDIFQLTCQEIEEIRKLVGMYSSEMQQKAKNLVLVVLRSNPLVHWWFKILTMGAFLGVMIVCGIDGLNPKTFYTNFVTMKLNNASEILPQPQPHFEKPNQIASNLTRQTIDSAQTQITKPFNPIPRVSPNLGPTILPWISAEFGANYSPSLITKWLTPGGEPCKDSRTVNVKIPNFDGNEKIELSTGDVHEFVFQALDDSGMPHCSGGDYYETDLSGEKWKCRPPVKDLGNGTYTFSLQIHPDFAGDYNFTIILLFRSWEGLKFSPERFAFDKVLRVVTLKFRRSALVQMPELRHCENPDFSKDVWSGRWTRHGRNDSCLISDDGRYRCQEPSFPCQHPWCDGPLGLLESNGWVYSAHCSFKLFTSEEAWNVLDKRWIFWWGDSNHCDTIRNVLHLILDVNDVLVVPRRFDMNITNSRNPSQVVRFTSIFNGHPNDTGNYQGLNSLINAEYRESLQRYFSENAVPDTVIMNSGLHDGIYWPNIRRFIRGADYAAAFWADVMDGVARRGLARPRVIYRTTVATGGYARRLAFNPHKMEAFNGVVLDKMRQYAVVDRIIDDFDMTYPWHYDNRCNDGVHYGRAPAKRKWRDGKIGHQYFVDLMLGHVLVNAMRSG